MSESAIKRLMALSGGGDATQENIRRLAAEHPDLWKAALEELFRDALSKTIANPLYGPPGSRAGSVRLEALVGATIEDGEIVNEHRAERAIKARRQRHDDEEPGPAERAIAQRRRQYNEDEQPLRKRSSARAAGTCALCGGALRRVPRSHPEAKLVAFRCVECGCGVAP